MATEPTDYYDGSRAFTWISNITGVSVDQVNFIISQFVALGLASLFRTVLHPSKTSAAARHGFGLIIGLIIGYFCFGIHILLVPDFSNEILGCILAQAFLSFNNVAPPRLDLSQFDLGQENLFSNQGRQAIHLAGLPAICYIVIRTQNPEIMQRMVLFVALTYLSCIHLHRQIYDYGSYTLDITGPLMVIVQKVTSLAYNLHDGLTRPESDLTKNQKYYLVRNVPSPLEYFSYVLHFQALMAGPVLFYVDYINFINGTNLLVQKPTPSGHLDNNSNSRNVVIEPSPTTVVVKKVIASLACAVIFIKLIPMYSIESVKEDEFVYGNTGLLYKFVYLGIVTALVRCKYYHAWLFADAICNNSGLGFNGYAQDGTPKWDLISNIDIIKFEFSTSLRDSIEAWNIGTNRWLRMLVYERTKSNATVLTFALSALWHGFYPGYYVTFASGALFTFAARTLRRMFRDYFTGDNRLKLIYDIITALSTRFVMAYITFPFVLLDLWSGIRIYLRMYLCLHILALLAVFVVPCVMPRSPRREQTQSQPGPSTQNAKNINANALNNHNYHHHNNSNSKNGVLKNHKD